MGSRSFFRTARRASNVRVGSAGAWWKTFSRARSRWGSRWPSRSTAIACTFAFALAGFAVALHEPQRHHSSRRLICLDRDSDRLRGHSLVAAQKLLYQRVIQPHQLQILAVLANLPVRGDLQFSAIRELDLVHALLNSPNAMPRFLHRSGEEAHQPGHARLHVGEWRVVVQAEVIQVLELIEHHAARFLRVADCRLQLEASAL